MGAERTFLNLHVHSKYSARDGLIDVADVMKLAYANGEAVAICDHGALHAWYEIDMLSKAGNLKPIYGVEAYVNDKRDRMFEINRLLKSGVNKADKQRLNYEKSIMDKYDHIILIAKNYHGFQNIIGVMNHAYREGFYSKPIITYKELFDLPRDSAGDRGIIITTACIGGTLGKLIINDDKNAAREFVIKIKKEFGNDFYIEIQFNDMDEQRKVNAEALAIARECGIQLCIGSDAHFLNESQAVAHQDFLLLQNKMTRGDIGKKEWRITVKSATGSISNKKVPIGSEFKPGYPVENLKEGDIVKGVTIIKIQQVDQVWLSKSVHYRTEKELRAYGLTHHPEIPPELHDDIFNANCEIYSKIVATGFNRDIKLPKIENANMILSEMVYKALHERLPEKVNDSEYLNRISYELETIQGNGFSEYFLILYDIMKFAREKNIPVGAGRGSGVSSLVGYLLGIHNINPLYGWGITGLPFERFLSAERNNKKVIIRGKNGEKHEYLDTDIIRVNRNGHIVEVPAIELQKGDMPPQ